MSSRYQKTEKKPITPRQATTVKQYTQQLEVLRAKMTEAGFDIEKLEAAPFPATGGIRWTATVTIGSVPENSTPKGQAIKLVALTFPGVYQPVPWERRDLPGHPVEVSWFTNGHVL